jgi:hypothetical protein
MEARERVSAAIIDLLAANGEILARKAIFLCVESQKRAKFVSVLNWAGAHGSAV